MEATIRPASSSATSAPGGPLSGRPPRRRSSAASRRTARPIRWRTSLSTSEVPGRSSGPRPLRFPTGALVTTRRRARGQWRRGAGGSGAGTGWTRACRRPSPRNRGRSTSDAAALPRRVRVPGPCGALRRPLPHRLSTSKPWAALAFCTCGRSAPASRVPNAPSGPLPPRMRASPATGIALGHSALRPLRPSPHGCAPRFRGAVRLPHQGAAR
mmetsp:Transcript_73380/g.224454  ORF Transcript_73380/g.224454 Transcript_73380/m.224454 type:complete len:213 (+) Transcript_73380:258-896(+)